MATPSKTPRKQKTPAQRAQETLGITDRRLKKAKLEVGRLEATLTTARAELADAQARRDYAAKDPALKTTTSTAPEVTSISTPSTTGAGQ